MILYSTPPARHGRFEWRIEVRHTLEYDQNSVIPTWRKAGTDGAWQDPADFSQPWPAMLFKMAIEHVTDIAAHVATKKIGKGHTGD